MIKRRVLAPLLVPLVQSQSILIIISRIYRYRRKPNERRYCNKYQIKPEIQHTQKCIKFIQWVVHEFI